MQTEIFAADQWMQVLLHFFGQLIIDIWDGYWFVIYNGNLSLFIERQNDMNPSLKDYETYNLPLEYNPNTIRKTTNKDVSFVY